MSITEIQKQIPFIFVDYDLTLAQIKNSENYINIMNNYS